MPKTIPLIQALVAWCLVFSAGGRARGADADLAKILPGPTVIYIGWSGAAAIEPAYKETALGSLLAEPEFVQLRDALRPQIESMLKRRLTDAGAGDLHEPIDKVLKLLWQHPGAVSIMRLSLSKQGPEVQAAAVWHLGPDAETFEALLAPLQAALFDAPRYGTSALTKVTIGQAQLTQFSPGAPLPVLRWGRVGEYFFVTAGGPTTQIVVDALAGRSEKPPLIEHPVFAASRKGLAVAGDAMALNWYLSIEEVCRRLPLVATVMDLQQSRAQRAANRKAGRLPMGILVSKAIRTLNLKKIRSLSGSVSLEGNGYRIAWFLDAKTKGGLMRFFHQKPLADADLAVVPKTANYFYATNLDLRGFYEEMMAAFKAIDPKSYEGWLGTLADGERSAGVKLVDDLLAPLDDGWVFYSDSTAAAEWWSGLILLVEAKDVERAVKGMTALAGSIVEHIGGAEIQIATRTVAGGKTMYVVEDDTGRLGGITPAWSTVGKYVVIGLAPGAVEAAMKRLGADAGALADTSILKRPDFVIRRKHVPAGANAIGYLDAKDVLGWLYRMIPSMVSAAGPALSDMGIALDADRLPKPETVERHLSGMVTGLTAGDDGVLMVSYAPLPLPTPTARSAATVLGAVGIGKLMQNRRESAALADLRAIGLGCHRYAAAHDEKFPPSLDALVAEKLVDLDAQTLAGYALVAGLTPYDPPWCVLAYDASAVKAGAERVRAVRVTGKCARVPAEALSDALAKTRKLLTTRPATTKKAKD